MFKDYSETLHIGDRAPDFQLQTADRRTISNADLNGRSSLVVFLRGTW